jgi:hypothetical protein
MDLAEAAFGSRHIGARRLLALVVNLPRDSALHRARDPKTSWTQTDELLATLLNTVTLHRYEWLRSHGVDVDPPVLVESPWAPPPEPPVLSTGTELAAFLAAPITYAAGS